MTILRFVPQFGVQVILAKSNIGDGKNTNNHSGDDHCYLAILQESIWKEPV